MIKTSLQEICPFTLSFLIRFLIQVQCLRLDVVALYRQYINQEEEVIRQIIEEFVS